MAMKQTKIAFPPEQIERLRAYVDEKNRGNGPEWSIASTVRFAVQVYLDAEEVRKTHDADGRLLPSEAAP